MTILPYQYNTRPENTRVRKHRLTTRWLVTLAINRKRTTRIYSQVTHARMVVVNNEVRFYEFEASELVFILFSYIKWMHVPLLRCPRVFRLLWGTSIIINH